MSKSQEKITSKLISKMNKGEDADIAFSLDEPNPTDVKEFISTGSTVLDYMIANRRDGGIPACKITEIAGMEASGKSLLATQILANAQKKGGIAAYIDTENAANPAFMRRLGLDTKRLVYMQPGCIEECYESIEKIILAARTEDPDCPICIVWDSIAGTPAKAEIEGDYDANSRMGLAGKAHALGLRKITKVVGFENVTLVLTNQLKVSIGVMYGDPYYTPGGKAIPYHTSVRIRLTKSKAIDDGATGKKKEIIGYHTLAKVHKNRLGPPQRKCEFDIMFADGVNDWDSIRDYLWEVKGFIKKKGGRMYMPDPEGGDDISFYAKDWKKLMQQEDLRSYVMDALEALCIVTYDEPEDLGFDPDNLIEEEE